MLPQLSLLQLRPRVWSVNDRLYARTNLIARWLFLLSYDKTLIVDRGRKKATITTTWLWGIRSEQVLPFEKISHVDLDYSGFRTESEADGLLESFVVTLVMRGSGRRVKLFRFVGDPTSIDMGIQVSVGGFQAGGKDDSHEQDARAFLKRLSEFTGLSIGPPVRHLTSADGSEFYCADCKRRSSPSRRRCLYCGGAIEAILPRSPEKRAIGRAREKSRS